ncbi:MAG: protein kinase [Ardenticatenaceae bacterium]|nr:protein kinase [Ardenticatenaceae bacterium]
MGGYGELPSWRDRRTDAGGYQASLAGTRQAATVLSRSFQREAEILRQLNHPNIVHMLGMFEENGQHHIVMEYVPGGSLRHLLIRSRAVLEQALLVALNWPIGRLRPSPGHHSPRY